MGSKENTEGNWEERAKIVASFLGEIVYEIQRITKETNIWKALKMIEDKFNEKS